MMSIRNKLYQIGMRYLDAYLPEQHPILRNSTARRRLRIIMGVGTVFDIILVSKLPVVDWGDGIRSVMFLALVVVFTLGIAWILLTKARAADFITAVFIGMGVLHNIVDAYSAPIFPPRNLPFFFLIILSAHLLFGRWYSLVILIVLSAAYVPLIHVGMHAVIGAADASLLDYRMNLVTNSIIAGLMVWLLSEFYDYFREASENQLKALNREREQDLELAARMQQDLIPQMSRVGSFAISSATRPAALVGGDYHEAMRVGSTNWFAIGDVSGHGLQAGMLSMQIRSVLVYLLMELRLESPSEVLRELNNSFHQIVKKLNIRSFMTFLLVRIDDSGVLTYTGSHQNLLILRNRQRSIEVVPSHGIWLGLEHVDAANRLAEEQLILERGDALFLFTDGLLECRNASDESYGIDRLIKRLQSSVEATWNEKELTGKVMQDYDRFRGAVASGDDVTVFCIRYVTDQEA